MQKKRGLNPLKHTNEEIESFERVLASKSEKAEKMLNELIKELSLVLKDTYPLADRRKVAKKLQDFFDTLGDHSFYATRDHLRESPTMMGV